MLKRWPVFTRTGQGRMDVIVELTVFANDLGAG